ncbi:MAG: hypothetical protein RL059_949, partial [Bacteroidota bacterium]
MKSIITVTLFFLAIFCVNAQDVMTLKNGAQMNVFVSEVTPSLIKFKKTTDGPMYSMNLAQVISIVYHDGSTETFGADPKVAITKKDNLNDDLLSPSKRYGGPRVGMTYLGVGTSREKIAEAFNRGDITPWISQFGWQFETRIFTLDDGACGLVEFVPMIGGLEQGLFLPSASGILGFRTRSGIELGVGPNLSLSGVGLVMAAGASFKIGKVTFPINVVFSPNITKTTADGEEYDPITNTY